METIGCGVSESQSVERALLAYVILGAIAFFESWDFLRTLRAAKMMPLKKEVLTLFRKNAYEEIDPTNPTNVGNDMSTLPE
ncbi:hypothetical protein L484_023270 [Morus notabilis]|uniref:Uncharacterized protein n=1 Tax=Morus notabilis TaxID=981085 RepID=W9RNI7_9ROSA|nr:hypothetical protein L484_023270 [Morus notabilis]